MSETPRRLGRRFAATTGLALTALLASIILAQWLRAQPFIQDFMMQYPGVMPMPDGAPVGIPAWLAWQHFFNAFLLVLVVKTALEIRSKKRPPAFWTRNNTGLITTKKAPTRLGIYHWLHISVDVLWVINGLVFIILLVVTGQWMRVVPLSWEVFPNALSALLRYASLDWPTESAWTNYNSLQILSYFVTIFIAAPIAVKTGLRLSPVWPKEGWLHRIFPEKTAKAWHTAVLFYFFAFVIVHVTLVLATGAQANLNAMFAAQDSDTSWAGAIWFAIATVVMVAVWFLARPAVLKPLARLSGKVQG